MRRNHIIKHTCIAWSLILGLASCGDESLQDAHSLDAKSTPMTFMVSHPGKKITPKNTRATETDFEKNDKIGLFVAKADSPLEIGGNLVNNAALTYDGGKWTPAHTLYWDEGTYNAYAYYPYINKLSSIEDQPFNVSTDQSTHKSGTTLGGYEASDLLFAKTEGDCSFNSTSTSQLQAYHEQTDHQTHQGRGLRRRYANDCRCVCS